MEGKDQEGDAFPSTSRVHIVCMFDKIVVQDTYAASCAPNSVKAQRALRD